jgi:hypothetical protein
VVCGPPTQGPNELHPGGLSCFEAVVDCWGEVRFGRGSGRWEAEKGKVTEKRAGGWGVCVCVGRLDVNVQEYSKLERHGVAYPRPPLSPVEVHGAAWTTARSITVRVSE